MSLTFNSLSDAAMSLDLGLAERVVLYHICRLLTWSTWSGIASIKRIAHRAKVSDKTVQRCIASLIKEKLLTRQRRHSQYGEVASMMIVNAEAIMERFQLQEANAVQDFDQDENLNDFADGQSDPTPSQSDPTPSQSDPTPSQPDPTPRTECPIQKDNLTPPPDRMSFSRGQSVPPVSVLSVPSSVSSVDQSVDRPVESSVVLEQPTSETPRAETAEAPRWRTIPRQQRFAHQALYFSILEGLGYDFDETVHLRAVLQNNLIFPDQVDIQAFLTHYEH